MANEISITLNISASKGSFSFAKSKQFTANMAGVGGGNPGLVDVAGNTSISFGDVSPGWIWVENLDTAGDDHMLFGPDSGSNTRAPDQKLLAGEASLFRFDDAIGTQELIVECSNTSNTIQALILALDL